MLNVVPAMLRGRNVSGVRSNRQGFFLFVFLSVHFALMQNEPKNQGCKSILVKLVERFYDPHTKPIVVLAFAS